MAISMITVITLSENCEEQRETNKMLQAAARIARHFTTTSRLIPTLIRREMSNDYVTRRKTKTPAMRAWRGLFWKQMFPHELEKHGSKICHW